jgi:hypothetical protein
MEVPSLHPMIRNFGAPRHCPLGQLHHERLTRPPSRLTRLSKSSNSPGCGIFSAYRVKFAIGARSSRAVASRSKISICATMARS